MEWGLRSSGALRRVGELSTVKSFFWFLVCWLVLFSCIVFLLCFDGGTHATRVRIVELLGAVDVSTGSKYSCVPRGTAAGAV
jgi:hypothetical protein